MTDGVISEKIEQLAGLIEKSGDIVFFGGAGVSTESGIPDFRSKDGLYNRRDVRFENYRPEYLLSRDCLEDHPEVFFEFYRQKMDTRKTEPNAAHYALAELERRGKLKAVVTQNIDSLHQRAGSKNVFEIHGTTRKNYCAKCGEKYGEDFIFDSAEAIPRCPKCGGVVRCDVTLYGEALPESEVEGAVRAIASADMLIIGGTSLTVYPAASYVGYFRGSRLAIINKEPLGYPVGSEEFVEICAPIGEVLGRAVGLI